jgi:hypothetical protein
VSAQTVIPQRVGWWKFDQPGNMTVAESGFGNPLVLSGNHSPATGSAQGNGAVRIGVGSYYKLTHGIAPNGGGTKVNEYSIQFDFKLTELGAWRCFFQTTVNNSGDGDFFINPSGNIGVAAVGYSGLTVNPNEWYRMLISVKNGSFFAVYLDGKLLTQGAIQAVDGRFSLESQLLIFADEDGEDGTIECAELAIWDKPLTAAEALQLGGYQHTTPSAQNQQPYLQNPGQDRMTICWHDSAQTATSVVFGTDSAQLNQEVAGTSEIIIEPYRWHTVKITGLQPAIRYFYRVKNGDRQSGIFAFKTLPSGTFNGKIRFLMLSDTHSGDTTMAGKIARQAVKSISQLYGSDLENQITGIIHSGDVVMSGTSADQYAKQFFAPLKSLTASIPTTVVAGNHEVESSYFYQYLKVDDLSGLPGTPGLVEKVLQLKVGNSLFIGLNTNVISQYGNVQATWLNNRLKEVEQDAGIDFVFLFFHHPPHSELWDVVNTSDEGGRYVRDVLYPVIKKYSKVQQMYSGHTHGYERGTIQSSTPGGDFRMIIGGGSGGALDPWAAGANRDLADISVCISNYEFQILEIDIAGRSFTNTVYSLGTLNKPKNGEVIDSFYKKINQTEPAKPTVENVSSKAGKVVVQTSKFSGSDSLMSVHLQVFTDAAYTSVVFDTVINKVNIYGVDANGNPLDLNKNLDLYSTSIAESHFITGKTYHFRTRYRDNNLKWSAWSDLFAGLITSAETQLMLTGILVSQNYPNPFATETSIDYSIQTEGSVTFRIYNTLNQLVFEQHLGIQQAGFQTLKFKNTFPESGVYFYEISSGDSKQIKPMLIYR